MIDLQLPIALLIVAGAAGLLLRGPLKALVAARRPGAKPATAPAAGFGCSGCPAGGSCSKSGCS